MAEGLVTCAWLRTLGVLLVASAGLVAGGCMVPREHPFPAYAEKGHTSNLSGALDPLEVNRDLDYWCRISFVSLPSGTSGIWIRELGINHSSVVILLATAPSEARRVYRTGGGELRAWLLRGRWPCDVNSIGKPSDGEAGQLMRDPDHADPELAIPLVGRVEITMAKDADKQSEDGKIETLIVDLRTEHDIPVDARFYKWLDSEPPAECDELKEFERIPKQPPAAPAWVKGEFSRFWPKKMWPWI